jgi:glutathione peroxidase
MNYQYADWKAIKEDINDANFDLCAFPTKHFLLQEPGRDDEIMNLLEFVRPGDGFVPNYRVTAISEVNGGNELDLFTFLKDTCPGPTDMLGQLDFFFWTPIKQSDITWNYEKFLIGADGKPVRRYNPVTSPYSVQPDVQEQLDLINPRKSESVRRKRVLQGSVKKFNKTKP